jgi:DNA-binding SARP family transcriptional activator
MLPTRRYQVEVRLLGPIQVWRDGRPVDLGRPQQRCLLAVLALEPNRVVPVDRLTEIMWPAGAPRSVRNALQVMVSGLRRVLANGPGGEPARVVTRAPGYLLEVEPDDVDLHRFTRLVAASRHERDDAQRARLLREALGLWRGSALEDLPDEVRLRLSPSLEEARWSAVEDRVDADLHRGRRDAELLAELYRLVTAQPSRERLAAQYLTALYLAGRRAEALEYYHELRHRLSDAVGVDPAGRLARLHLAILRGEPLPDADDAVRPAAAVADRRPAQLPAVAAELFGRTAELRALDEFADSAGGGTGAVAVLVGAGGVGKTALALQWAHGRASRYPDGQLFLDLGGYADAARRLTAAEALERLLRDLGVPGDEIPSSTEERATLFRTLVAGRRLLLVLDNAWSSAQLRPLLPGHGDHLTVVTSRKSLDGLAARDGARLVQVRRLATPAAVDLLVAVSNGQLRDRPHAARELARRCDNLPLALRIAGARLAAADRPVEDVLAELTDPGTALDALSVEDGETAVHTTMAASYRALDAAGQRMLRLLAVAPGDGLDPLAAAALIDTTPADARRRLELLAAEHLVERRAGDTFGMHDLVRQLAVRRAEFDEPAPAQDEAVRRLLHWYMHGASAAQAVLAAGAIYFAPPLPQPPPPHRPTFTDAGAAFAWLDRQWPNLHAAVRDASARHLYHEVWQLANALEMYLRRRYLLTGYIDIYQLGLAAAAAAGDLDAEAVIAHGLGVAYSYARRVDDAVATYERAAALYARLGNGQRQAAVLGNIGSIYMEVGDYQNSERCLRRAGALAGDLGDRRVYGICQANLGLLCIRLGRLDEAEPLLDDALRTVDETGNEYLRATTLEYLGDLHAARREHDRAAGRYEEALMVARSIGEQVVEARCLRGLATALVRAGHAESGRLRARQALALVDRLGGPLASDIHRQLDELLAAVDPG